MTHPAPFKSSITNQQCAGSGTQAEPTSCQDLSNSKNMENTGNQSQRKGESYSEFMNRLYAADPYRKRKRDSNGLYIASHDWTERELWSFRVPNDLASLARKFMREENMSVTKYLTLAMHKLHQTEK